MIFLPRLVVPLDEIINLTSLNLCNLFFQLILKLFQDFTLTESLADAFYSAYVFRILLRCYQVQLVLLLALAV
jgi:hypothetical protein